MTTTNPAPAWLNPTDPEGKIKRDLSLPPEGVDEADCIVFMEMDKTGDTKTIWNPNEPFELENARVSFANLKKNGYAIFRVDPKDPAKQGEHMTEFDGKAGAFIAVKPMAGG